MIKFKLYLDKDKETAWLNEMAGNGYAMTGFFAGFYRFAECQPGEFLYQVDITGGLFHVGEEYRTFMTEMGVEIVCLWGPWVILRKRAEDGPFELYTDVESTIENYKKIRTMFKIVAILEICCLLLELYMAETADGTAVAGAFILGILVFAVLRQILHINGILSELNGRLGKEPGHLGIGENRKVSGVLLAGLLCNSAALLLRDTIGDFWRILIQILAIVLMLAGIWLTSWRKDGE